LPVKAVHVEKVVDDYYVSLYIVFMALP